MCIRDSSSFSNLVKPDKLPAVTHMNMSMHKIPWLILLNKPVKHIKACMTCLLYTSYRIRVRHISLILYISYSVTFFFSLPCLFLCLKRFHQDTYAQAHANTAMQLSLIHIYGRQFVRLDKVGETTVINAYEKYIVEI